MLDASYLFDDETRSLNSSWDSAMQPLPDDPAVAEKELVPGDIIFTHYHKNHGLRQRLTTFGQSLQRRGSRELNSYVHAAIYIGEGQFAETVIGKKEGVDLAIHRLGSEYFQIKQPDKQTLRVFRCSDPSLGILAAELARKLTAEPGEAKSRSLGRYSMKSAALSILRNEDFGPRAQKSYLQGTRFSLFEEVPMEKGSPKNFHCSYFVGWIYQAAEAVSLAASLNEELAENDKIHLPSETVQKTSQKQKLINHWLSDGQKKYGKKLKERTRLDWDPKALSVKSLVNSLLERPDLFTPVIEFYSSQS